MKISRKQLRYHLNKMLNETDVTLDILSTDSKGVSLLSGLVGRYDGTGGSGPSNRRGQDPNAPIVSPKNPKFSDAAGVQNVDTRLPVYTLSRQSNPGQSQLAYDQMVGSIGNGETPGFPGEYITAQLLSHAGPSFVDKMSWPNWIASPPAIGNFNTPEGLLNIASTQFPAADVYIGKKDINVTMSTKVVASNELNFSDDFIATSVKMSGNSSSREKAPSIGFAGTRKKAGLQPHHFSGDNLVTLPLFFGAKWAITNYPVATNPYKKTSKKGSNSLAAFLISKGINKITIKVAGINICAIPYFSAETRPTDPILFGIYATGVKTHTIVADGTDKFKYDSSSDAESLNSTGIGKNPHELIGLINAGSISSSAVSTAGGNPAAMTQNTLTFAEDPAYQSAVNTLTRSIFILNNAKQSIKEYTKSSALTSKINIKPLTLDESDNYKFLVLQMIKAGQAAQILKDVLSSSTILTATEVQKATLNSAMTQLGKIKSSVGQSTSLETQISEMINVFKKLEENYKIIKETAEKANKSITDNPTDPASIAVIQDEVSLYNKILAQIESIKTNANAIYDFIDFLIGTNVPLQGASTLTSRQYEKSRKAFKVLTRLSERMMSSAIKVMPGLNDFEAALIIAANFAMQSLTILNEMTIEIKEFLEYSAPVTDLKLTIDDSTLNDKSEDSEEELSNVYQLQTKTTNKKVPFGQEDRTAAALNKNSNEPILKQVAETKTYMSILRELMKYSK